MRCASSARSFRVRDAPFWRPRPRTRTPHVRQRDRVVDVERRRVRRDAARPRIQPLAGRHRARREGRERDRHLRLDDQHLGACVLAIVIDVVPVAEEITVVAVEMRFGDCERCDPARKRCSTRRAEYRRRRRRRLGRDRRRRWGGGGRGARTVRAPRCRFRARTADEGDRDGDERDRDDAMARTSVAGQPCVRGVDATSCRRPRDRSVVDPSRTQSRSSRRR